MVDNLTKFYFLKFGFSVFCYSAQINEKSDKESCHAKDGNPFGPFWSHFNIDFDGDIFYHPLYFDIINPDGWNAR